MSGMTSEDWSAAFARFDAPDYNRAVPTAQPFKFVPVADLQIREPRWLVSDLIETDSLGLLFGDPGCGKSFIAVDLALAVATGAQFHGLQVQKGSVFYIAGEGHNGLSRRFHAWAHHHDETLDGVPLYKSERAAQFLDGASAKAVGDAIASLAASAGSPALIIVDTLARNFGAGDENSTQDMNYFIAAMDDLQGRYSESVLLVVHHTGHGDKQRARGAIALKGALDFEYRLDNAGGIITLTNTKMKDAEPPAQRCFKLECVTLGEGGDGKPYGSAVLVDTDAPASSGKKLTANQKLGLETFRVAAIEYGTLSDGAFTGLHVEHWRELFYRKHTGDNADSKRRTFNRVRRDLVDSGILSVNDELYVLRGNQGVDLLDEILLRDGTGGDI